MPRVMISGAGIARTVLAYWLGKNGFQVVVVERSLSSAQSGQIIDVEGPAQEIVTRMGLMEDIKSKVTHEAGIRFIDDSGREFAVFPVGTTGVSSEIEIMRPALAGVLLAAADSFPTSNSAMAAPSRMYSKLRPRSSLTSTTKPTIQLPRSASTSSLRRMACVHQLVTSFCQYLRKDPA